VIKINKAIDCPGEAREDWVIIQDLARALNRPHGFTFNGPTEIFEELRIASKGGVADYWVPMLIILGIWRHIYRRFPLRYDPLYWGAVFPLGMYTACTFG
jgi:anaerobic selenocysteine-containing dehydrogenase